MIKILVSLAIACALGTVIALGAAAPVTLAVPGRANANVSMAAEGSFVALVWAASTESGTTDIYAAVSRDAGATFSPPSRVNSTPGDARANGEQPPRIVLVPRSGGQPQVDVVWTAKRGKNTVLLTQRSTDLARTFAPTAIVPGSDAAGNRGWQAAGSDTKGGVHVVWLDHRRLAERDSQMAAMHHHDDAGASQPTTATKPDGVATAQLSQLFFSTLGDASGPRALTGGVCYCCKTAIAGGPAGEVYLAWRHVYPGNLRDIAFVSSRDGGRTFSAPIRISEDKWAIEGCPEDGPTMAVDKQGQVHVVWPTVVMTNGEPVKALFHAMSRDGRGFTPRERIPTEGQANHPQLALTGDGSLVVVWDESGSGTRRLAVARKTIDAGGRARFRRDASGATTLGTYPDVAAVVDGLVMAWTTGDPSSSVIRINRLK